MLCTLCGCWSLWWHFSSFLRKSRITHVHGWHKRLLFLCSSPAQVNVITEISYCFIFTEQWEHTFGCLHWELPHKILILMQFLMVPLPVGWKVFKDMSYPNSRMVSCWVRSYTKSLILYAGAACFPLSPALAPDFAGLRNSRHHLWRVWDHFALFWSSFLPKQQDKHCSPIANFPTGLNTLSNIILTTPQEILPWLLFRTKATLMLWFKASRQYSKRPR